MDSQGLETHPPGRGGRLAGARSLPRRAIDQQGARWRDYEKPGEGNRLVAGADGGQPGNARLARWPAEGVRGVPLARRDLFHPAGRDAHPRQPRLRQPGIRARQDARLSMPHRNDRGHGARVGARRRG